LFLLLFVLFVVVCFGFGLYVVDSVSE